MKQEITQNGMHLLLLSYLLGRNTFATGLWEEPIIGSWWWGRYKIMLQWTYNYIVFFLRCNVSLLCFVSTSLIHSYISFIYLQFFFFSMTQQDQFYSLYFLRMQRSKYTTSKWGKQGSRRGSQTSAWSPLTCTCISLLGRCFHFHRSGRSNNHGVFLLF